MVTIILATVHSQERAERRRACAQALQSQRRCHHREVNGFRPRWTQL